MTSSYNSDVTSFDSYNTDERNAQTRTDWSFAWEFDWSPAAPTSWARCSTVPSPTLVDSLSTLGTAGSLSYFGTMRSPRINCA
jgi:hypothetical protein